MSDVIDKVIHFISGDSEPASDKDILLKQLGKEISQNKYAKFYRIKQREVDASFAQYFYGLYRAIYPLQVFLKDPANEAKIKQVTLEAFLDKHIMDMIKHLSPEAITERKKTAAAGLSSQLEEELAALVSGFDNPKIAAADACYDLITSVRQFALFDFCSMLKKFDPEIREGDFLSHPKFTEVDASFLSPELAALLSILPDFEENSDWKTVFEIFKYCKGGTDVIPQIQWHNLLAGIKDLKQSKILDLIGKMATGNPIWEIKHSAPSHETLSASWLEQKSREVRGVITGILGGQRSAQISALVNAVFGSAEATRLSFYTSEKERILLDKGVGGYIYASALNHLFAFVQDFIEKEIHELCDILLVRGQWTNNSASRQMSEGYHEVMGIIREITALDESLDDDGSNGSRLRGALLRVDRDKTQTRYINSIINTVNEEALNMINRTVPSLIVVGKHFKMLLDDVQKKPFELVMNWKELALYSKTPISQRIGDAYKKINYFVQLMVLETKPLEE
ncbi:MAG: DUF5312 family protein [Treponema sp.]|nr:DUF5312 family protein [Treponema sp.]